MTKTVTIGNRSIGTGHPCFIIAEAGVNHNGDIRLARRLVDHAAVAGVDAIKFQTFFTDNVESKNALKPSYFSGREDSVDKIAFSRSLELSCDEFSSLKVYTEFKGLVFLSTACDMGALDFLVDLNVSGLKIGSSDTNNYPLLKKAAQSGLPVILSTGISSSADVTSSVGFLRKSGCIDLIILQCTSNYPAKPEEINLKVIPKFSKLFNCPVGLSDHSDGIWASIGAVAFGASVIEKHFTISKNLPGVDHPASLEPLELKTLVRNIRDLELAMGDGEKVICDSEKEHLITMRKSIVASKSLKKGIPISADDLAIKRPGNGIPPSEIDSVIGKKLKRSISKDDMLSWDILE